jgi:hypothetical protein
MSKEMDKLKAGDKPTDVFYPRGYVIAGFATPERAEQVRKAAKQAGFADEHIVVIKSNELLVENRQRKEIENNSVAGKLQAFFSNMGDDSNFVEQYVDLARKGHTFVLIYAPSAEETERVRHAILPFDPQRPRKYDQAVVTDLVLTESGM